VVDSLGYEFTFDEQEFESQEPLLLDVNKGESSAVRVRRALGLPKLKKDPESKTNRFWGLLLGLRQESRRAHSTAHSLITTPRKMHKTGGDAGRGEMERKGSIAVRVQCDFSCGQVKWLSGLLFCLSARRSRCGRDKSILIASVIGLKVFNHPCILLFSSTLLNATTPALLPLVHSPLEKNNQKKDAPQNMSSAFRSNPLDRLLSTGVKKNQ